MKLNKLKLAIKNETKVVLGLSSNMIGDNENNFLHKLVLTNRHYQIFVKLLQIIYHHYLSPDIKLSRTQLSKMIQSRGFLSRLLGPLLKTGFPLKTNLIKPLAKIVLIPLGLTAAASAADAGIHKKILGSGNMITLIISNDQMNDIIKIVKSLEDSG